MDKERELPNVLSPGRLLRVGHRGAAFTNPHNTRVSFEEAFRVGVDMVETDIRQCASGELVLAHDDHLKDLQGQSFSIREHKLCELEEVDLGCGQRIMTLDSLLTLAAGRAALMLDLKGEDFEEQLAVELRSSGFPSHAILIPGASSCSRERLRELAPEYALSLSLDSFPPAAPSREFLDSIDTPAVTWHYRMLNPAVITDLHERDKTVYAWTVDREDDMRRLLSWGVDGIITNRPDLLNQVGGRGG